MEAPSHSKNILLISDNQIDIRRIEQQFMDKGSLDCRLLRCTTSSAANEVMGRKGVTVDAVILDLRLTDATAFTFLVNCLFSFVYNINCNYQ